MISASRCSFVVRINSGGAGPIKYGAWNVCWFFIHANESSNDLSFIPFNSDHSSSFNFLLFLYLVKRKAELAS
jgi:hypothetical protein